MTAEEKEKFLKGQKEFKQKKEAEKYMEKMMDNFDNMTE